ncbi:archaeosortase A [Natronomonas salsuginis]|uniref:Archaeosortase A n=1 Tax=Natronomonas salsuginis TaxID=2217661 RepID=A0A4U5JFN3_9EURY|nr:archaeosortase A [Natronomonas salsuginis]TKR28202.1 archaeosortase A [Natronomonas salsuginis]
MAFPLQSLTEFSVLPYTDVLAWIIMAVFVGGVIADRRGRRDLALRVTTAAWGLFAIFWFLLIHHFAFIHRSAIQTVLIVIAVPACLYVGWRVYNGRDSLLTLSRAIAFMTIIYLPFETSAFARTMLIETVAVQTSVVIDLLGIGDGIQFIQDPAPGSTVMNTFWVPETGQASRIVFACTGIEAMAIFGGLIGAVDASRRKKAIGIAVSIAIIWVLNIGRNVFIAVANGYQWFAGSWLEGPVMFLFGISDPARVSFFVADRVISQGLAVFALVGIAFLVSRWVPELLDVGEELLSVLLGRNVTLRSPETAPDGGERES